MGRDRIVGSMRQLEVQEPTALLVPGGTTESDDGFKP